MCSGISCCTVTWSNKQHCRGDGVPPLWLDHNNHDFPIVALSLSGPLVARSVYQFHAAGIRRRSPGNSQWGKEAHNPRPWEEQNPATNHLREFGIRSTRRLTYWWVQPQWYLQCSMGETQTQRAQLSHTCIPDPQKLWENRYCFSDSNFWDLLLCSSS